MAWVLLARAVGASGFEKPVALKILRPELADDGELERLLVSEAKQGARLRHRNLVAIHNLGIDDHGYFVVMEWVDGSNLAALVRRRPLDERLALSILGEVADALSYIATVGDDQGRPLGLVHRDVSPSNVLVSRSGEVKLADFGIAKATKLAQTTRASIRRGKYAYMSPEQVRGEALSPQSDQFGFGVMFYELFAGQRPYDGATPAETMDRIREAAPPDVRAFAADVGAIVARCLARDPGARFETTDALVAALSEARWRRAPCTSRDVARWAQDALEATS